MIGQRYVSANGFGAVRARAISAPPRRSAKPRRLPSIPAVAGREYLSSLLGKSVLAKLMLAMSLVAVALMLYLAQASQESVLQFNIAALQEQQTQLNVQNANLTSQATSLQSFGRIDWLATNQLHMVKPDINNTVWVQPLVPQAPPAAATGVTVPQAQRDSEPTAWMSRFVDFVKNSL